MFLNSNRYCRKGPCKQRHIHNYHRQITHHTDFRDRHRNTDNSFGLSYSILERYQYTSESRVTDTFTASSSWLGISFLPSMCFLCALYIRYDIE
jgi:hypothetical protein